MTTPSYDGAVADPVRARMWESGGRWVAQVLGSPVFLEVTGTSKHGCLAELRAAIGDDVTLTVELLPPLAGVAEAAEIMGWDKRRVITYIDRGHFPEPFASLAGGWVWLREDVESYPGEWGARRAGKAAGGGGWAVRRWWQKRWLTRLSVQRRWSSKLRASSKA